jgi:hypothetical protein
MSDEIEVVDHRPIAAPPGLGPDAALALAQSALDVTNDLRFETGEVVSSDERTVALRGSWIGTAANGEGELSLQMGMVVTIDAEKVTALHLYEHDDLEAIRRHARGA